MEVQIAFAEQGFIPVVNSPNLSNSDNFLQCLQKILTFESASIQEFDGNSCKLIRAENPTNSVFIYTNEQGTFLYQITNAVPVVHKNRKIWLCDTYEMENMSKINDIFDSVRTLGNVRVTMLKNSAAQYSTTSSDEFNAEADKPVQKVTIKDNFTPKMICGLDISPLTMCLKIKCLVNPTTDALTSNASDGSYNFFFPIALSNNEYVDGNNNPTGDRWQQWSRTIKNSATNTTLSLTQIISKYSPNIKSIELIPFYPFDAKQTSGGGYIQKDNAPTIHNDTFTITLGTNAVWTDCGVFIRQGSTNFGNGTIYGSQIKEMYNKQLILGGGARGFLRTPLGNVELDFADNRNKTFGDDASLEAIILDEGWAITGFAKCKVPPHYINFYTDNAGQVFIQNLTTNAQELRALNRESAAKWEEQRQNYVYGQMVNAIDTASNAAGSLLGLDLFGAGRAVAQGAINAGKIAMENEFNKDKIKREYNNSLASYRDKIATGSLLASMTGKQISGNVTLSDFLKYLRTDYFRIFIEYNYAYKLISGTTTDFYYAYYPQPDYDYSTSAVPNVQRPLGSETGAVEEHYVLLKTNALSDYTSTLMKKIFGYSATGSYFEDKIGLSYSIVFYLENYARTQSDGMGRTKFSKILNFPIRRTKKILHHTE